MDVDSLRNELEEHLKRNPDADAPSGFRDRFAAIVEDIEAADDEESKAGLQAALQQIRAEAEAAANCACEPAEVPETGTDKAEAVEAKADEPLAEAPVAVAPPAEPTSEPVAEPVSGPMQRYGLIAAAVLVALAVALYFYR